MWHKTSDKQHLEQCWFPGVHANNGGQAEYPLRCSDRSELAANTLAWMVRLHPTSRYQQSRIATDSYPYQIDNIGTALTFENAALDMIVSEHSQALLQNGTPDGWGCGKIIDNFAGLQGAFFRLLGQSTRTPGGYSDTPGATNEFMHPIVRYRKEQVSSWKPPSLAGFHFEGPGNSSSKKIVWAKLGQKAMSEYVMSPAKTLAVSCVADDGSWTFAERSSLARQLCPPSVLEKLDGEAGMI